VAVEHKIEIYCGADINKKPMTRFYTEGEVCLVFDELPELILRCTNKGKLKGKDKEIINLEQGKRLALGLTGNWHSYPVYTKKNISTERGFGFSSFTLDYPKVTVSYYVIPSKILSPIDVLWMIRDIEKMFGSFQVWSDDNNKMRAYANSNEYNAFINHTSTLIKYVKEELLAAQALTRSPYEEMQPNNLSYVILPENNLVTSWAVKRHNELVAIESKLRVNAAELRDRSPKEILPSRLQELNTRLENNSLFRDDIGAIIAQLTRYIKDHPGFIELSPAMQRDYRLRKLLHAFAPPKKETLTFEKSMLSTLPPILLPDLFEIWCSAVLVRWLEVLGFKLSSSRPFKDETSGRLVGFIGDMLFEDIVVSLNYEVQPRRLQGIPKNSDRTETALEWAGRTQCADDELFGIVNQCTPDFIIKITGPKGFALAIGDATLADPEYITNAGTKENKLNTYRYGLGWRIAGETIGCHARGIFLMYPGPHNQWSKLEENLSEYDCYLFSPVPSNEFIAPPESFRHMIHSLISSVSSTAPELHENPSKRISNLE
jgi:hypothetical protein